MKHEILKIVAGQLRLSEADIRPDSDLVEELGADSLDIVEILFAIEAEWGVTVPDDVIPELKTPRLLASYIDSHLPAGRQP